MAILSGVTPTTKETRTVVVQMFGTEKIATITPTAKPTIKTTTTTVKPTTTTLLKTTTTSLATTTTEEIVINQTPLLNATIKADGEVTVIKEETMTALKNLTPILNKQLSDTKNSLALNTEVIGEMINPKLTKAINNGLGLGLLFLGIFGIISINAQDDISNMFKKRLLAKNALILVIGLGFILNNLTALIFKIKVPTI
ncbi:MAG TPA: hypothetical protein P5052_00525 [Candidatus Paceibacterota bacterium]|nr:hypothetical protein [Candidatus Paceibacterota bacterium]HRZ29286.1 hypothetical protein [Candidatus Paceibacterota bacterium]